MLEGRTALITGAGSGLGAKIASTFAEHGATVFGLDATGPPLADGAAATPLPTVVPCDVSDAADVESMIAAIVEAGGPIDILVNSAGVREVGDVLDMDPAEWNRVLSVNLNGTFYCAQAVARHMVSARRGGTIVNIASVTGLIAIKNRPAYTASKHGVVGLTKSLAADLGGHGIRVNCLCPGVVETPMTAGYATDPAFLGELAKSVPLGRIGIPSDVAGPALFFASDLSRYVTGTAMPVDGGFVAEKALAAQAAVPQAAS